MDFLEFIAESAWGSEIFKERLFLPPFKRGQFFAPGQGAGFS